MIVTIELFPCALLLISMYVLVYSAISMSSSLCFTAVKSEIIKHTMFLKSNQNDLKLNQITLFFVFPQNM